VGFVGSLRPQKGAAHLVELARRCPGVQFEIVGGEDAEVGALRASAAGLPNVVCHGQRSPVDALAFQREMDILAAPSRRIARADGHTLGLFPSPMKLFEYMAAGRPILASDLDTFREVLIHDETALLAPSADVDAWAEALERLADVALRRRLGAAARARLLERHTFERRAADILALHERSRRNAA
jgi:glycosyltransferase involved in cell wall biosynthesis